MKSYKEMHYYKANNNLSTDSAEGLNAQEYKTALCHLFGFVQPHCLLVNSLNNKHKLLERIHGNLLNGRDNASDIEVDPFCKAKMNWTEKALKKVKSWKSICSKIM